MSNKFQVYNKSFKPEAIPSSQANKFEENHGVEQTNKIQFNTKDLITQLEEVHSLYGKKLKNLESK